GHKLRFRKGGDRRGRDASAGCLARGTAKPVIRRTAAFGPLPDVRPSKFDDEYRTFAGIQEILAASRRFIGASAAFAGAKHVLSALAQGMARGLAAPGSSSTDC